MQSDFVGEVKEWLRRRRKDFDRVGVSNPLILAAYAAIANGPDDRRRALLFGRSHLNLAGRAARFGWKSWPVRDGVTRYELPLRDECAGFDWARALTALGHDVEVKQVYRFLVRETPRSRFIDIGANFGQHSHYFMAAGWDVWSFEPNETCREYHERVCRQNGWAMNQWRDVALSDRSGRASLSFAVGQEFLGRLDSKRLGATEVSIEVEVRPLSAYFESIEDAVVKVDVEGHESRVFRGFPPGLDRVRCLLFEALDSEELRAALEILNRASLQVEALELGGTRPVEEALQRRLTNFAAAPANSSVQRWLSARRLT